MPLKIALSTYSGYGNWFTLRLQEEGHRVDIYQSKPEYANILGGIVPKNRIVQGRNYPDYGRYDLSVFDLTGRPRQANFSASLCPTIGDGSFNCQAEDDRLFGLQIMEQAGIQVPPYQQFSDVNSAAQFVKETGKRYVYKPNGGQDQDTDTTYVSEDAGDMLANLPKLFTKTKGAPFILQEFIKGTEVSIEGWFNGEDFYLVNCTLEEKKFMNGGKGPNTGCAGNLIFHFGNSEPKVFRDGLKKMAPILKAAGYVGMIDLNTIATPMGLYGLEWTPRFGYDASAAFLQLYGGNFGEMLQRTCLGQRPDISWRAEFAAGVRLSIPPYPSEFRGKHPAGISCDGIAKEDYASTFMYDLELQKDDLVTAGHSGFVCTPMGTGNSISEAFDECEDRVKRIKLANAQYRTDIGNTVRQRYYQLDRDGWLK
jgi:phosphoribosylamine--glycine ligase